MYYTGTVHLGDSTGRIEDPNLQIGREKFPCTDGKRESYMETNSFLHIWESRFHLQMGVKGRSNICLKYPRNG